MTAFLMCKSLCVWQKLILSAEFSRNRELKATSFAQGRSSTERQCFGLLLSCEISMTVKLRIMTSHRRSMIIAPNKFRYEWGLRSPVDPRGLMPLGTFSLTLFQSKKRHISSTYSHSFLQSFGKELCYRLRENFNDLTEKLGDPDSLIDWRSVQIQLLLLAETRSCQKTNKQTNK